MNPSVRRTKALAAVRRDRDPALDDVIRPRLALPVTKRMHFLRKRVNLRGSAA